MEENKDVKGKKDKDDSVKEGIDIKAEIISWVKVVVFAVALAWFLATFVLFNAYIPSASMENTLKEGDRLIGLRTAYWFSEPERLDVVIFKFPDNEEQYFIKRVIGLPGETVTVQGGKVYINDSKVPLDEDAYLKEEVKAIGDGVYKVPEDSYFVMGDNRNHSHDSRLWENKFVHKDKIMAKAMFRFSPKFTWIKTDY